MSRTAWVMPPDAGSTNNGVACNTTVAGRGIPRTGDIRHIGDNAPQSCSANAQTWTLTPGTNAASLTVAYGDSQKAVNNGSDPDFGFDAADHPLDYANEDNPAGSDGTAGAANGLDGACEGFDGYGKAGRQS